MAISDYRDFAPHLMARIGRYCAYCERTVPCSLAVEHKRPKRHAELLALDWYNLLLACANCNSAKQDVDVPPHQALWPDEHDTFRMVSYHETGLVAPASDLPPEQTTRVNALLSLLGLSKTPAQITTSDHRWFDRLEVFRKALQAAEDLGQHADERLRRSTIEVAKSSGGYSIWRAVFAHDPDMTQRLIAAFPGTRSDSVSA